MFIDNESLFAELIDNELRIILSKPKILSMCIDAASSKIRNKRKNRITCKGISKATNFIYS